MRGGDAYLLLGCPSVGFDRAAYGQGVAGVVGQPSGSIEAVARDGEAGDGELGVERLVRFYAQLLPVLFIGNKSYELKKGDSFYFKSEKVHFLKNVGAKTAKILWVSSPPNF